MALIESRGTRLRPAGRRVALLGFDGRMETPGPPRSRRGASHRASLPAPSWDLHRNPKDLTS